MKHQRKFTAFLFLLFTLSSFSLSITSCGKSEKKFPSGDALLILLPDDSIPANIIEIAASAFTKKTGIPVKLQKTARAKLYEKLSESFSSWNTAYDVSYVDTNWLSEFAKEKQLEPLDSAFSKEDRENILPAALSAHSFEGKLYAAPWACRVWVLMLNEEMLQKAGIAAPPATWDEFVAVSLLLRSKSVSQFPVVWAWKEPENIVDSFAATVLSFGGKMFDGKGNPLFNKMEGVLALTFLKESQRRISEPASVTYDEKSAMNNYMTGKSAMTANWHAWNAIANASENSKARGHSRIAPLPAMMRNIHAVLLDAAGFSIPSNAKHKKEAVEFVKFMTGADAQRELAMKTGMLPALKSLYNDTELNEVIPLMPMYASLVQNAQSVRKPAGYVKFLYVLHTELQKSLTGKKSPKQALDDAARSLSKK